MRPSIQRGRRDATIIVSQTILSPVVYHVTTGTRGIADRGCCIGRPLRPRHRDVEYAFTLGSPVSKVAAPGLVRAYWVDTEKPPDAYRTKSDRSWRFGADLPFIKIIGIRLFLDIARYLSFLLE